MEVEKHKRVTEYDGAFWCLDCGAQWGALPGHPEMPEGCGGEVDMRAIRQRKYMEMDKQALVLHLLEIEAETDELLREVKCLTLKYEARNIIMNTVRELLSIDTESAVMGVMKRETKREHIYEADMPAWDLDGTAEEVIGKLVEKWKGLAKKDYTDIHIEFVDERGYTSEVCFTGDRLETDEEVAQREQWVREEEERQEKYKVAAAKREKTLYNKLKKKYGGK